MRQCNQISGASDAKPGACLGVWPFWEWRGVALIGGATDDLKPVVPALEGDKHYLPSLPTYLVLYFVHCIQKIGARGKLQESATAAVLGCTMLRVIR